MKWFVILISAFSILMSIYLLCKGIKDGKEIDESSPENIEIDKTLKVLLLRKKLEQIEENIHQINTDEENDKLKLNSPLVL